MKKPAFYMKKNKSLNEPDCNQGMINGWYISWNPDDERFYVCKEDDGIPSATFKVWGNTVFYATHHDAKLEKDGREVNQNDA